MGVDRVTRVAYRCVGVDYENVVGKPLKELEEHGYAIVGAPPQWLRGHATFDGKMIRLDSSNAELYQPYSASGLPYDLAAVQRPSEVIEFVRQYGLLWHGPGASEFSEPYSDWERAIDNLQAVLDVYGSLREATTGDESATDQLRELLEKPTASDEDILTEGGVVVAILMSKGLEGVEIRLTTDGAWDGGDPSKFLYMARAENLIGYIYHHLSTVLVTKERLGACLDCQRYFVVRDPRQRYCNEKCSYRSRYRTWKAKRPKEVADE